METGVAKMNFSSFQIVAQQQRQPKMVSNSQWTMNGVGNYFLKKMMLNK